MSEAYSEPFDASSSSRHLGETAPSRPFTSAQRELLLHLYLTFGGIRREHIPSLVQGLGLQVPCAYPMEQYFDLHSTAMTGHNDHRSASVDSHGQAALTPERWLDLVHDLWLGAGCPRLQAPLHLMQGHHHQHQQHHQHQHQHQEGDDGNYDDIDEDVVHYEASVESVDEPIVASAQPVAAPISQTKPTSHAKDPVGTRQPLLASTYSSSNSLAIVQTVEEKGNPHAAVSSSNANRGGPVALTREVGTMAEQTHNSNVDTSGLAHETNMDSIDYSNDNNNNENCVAALSETPTGLAPLYGHAHSRTEEDALRMLFMRCGARLMRSNDAAGARTERLELTLSDWNRTMQQMSRGRKLPPHPILEDVMETILTLVGGDVEGTLAYDRFQEVIRHQLDGVRSDVEVGCFSNRPAEQPYFMRHPAAELPPTWCMVLAALDPNCLRSLASPAEIAYLRSVCLLTTTLQFLIQNMIGRCQTPRQDAAVGGWCDVNGVARSGSLHKVRFNANPEELHWQEAPMQGGLPPKHSQASRASTMRSASQPLTDEPRYMTNRPQDEIAASIVARAKARKLIDELRRSAIPINRYQWYVRAAAADEQQPVVKMNFLKGLENEDVASVPDSDALPDMEEMLATTVPVRDVSQPPLATSSVLLKQAAQPQQACGPFATGRFKLGGIFGPVVSSKAQAATFERLSKPQCDVRMYSITRPKPYMSSGGVSSTLPTTRSQSEGTDVRRGYVGGGGGGGGSRSASKLHSAIHRPKSPDEWEIEHSPLFNSSGHRTSDRGNSQSLSQHRRSDAELYSSSSLHRPENVMRALQEEEEIRFHTQQAARRASEVLSSNNNSVPSRPSKPRPPAGARPPSGASSSSIKSRSRHSAAAVQSPYKRRGKVPGQPRRSASGHPSQSRSASSSAVVGTRPVLSAPARRKPSSNTSAVKPTQREKETREASAPSLYERRMKSASPSMPRDPQRAASPPLLRVDNIAAAQDGHHHTGDRDPSESGPVSDIASSHVWNPPRDGLESSGSTSLSLKSDESSEGAEFHERNYYSKAPSQPQQQQQSSKGKPANDKASAKRPKNIIHAHLRHRQSESQPRSSSASAEPRPSVSLSLSHSKAVQQNASTASTPLQASYGRPPRTPLGEVSSSLKF